MEGNRPYSSIQKNLLQRIEELTDPLWLMDSRIHPLNSISDTWILREDESGFGISGTKRRKLASLIPWLKKERIDQVAVIGGANSNHVVAVVQALNEAKIQVQGFLLEGRDGPKRGNAMLTSLLLSEEKVTRISRADWPEVEQTAAEWAAEQAGKVYVIPEGGNCPHALPGVATVALAWVGRESSPPFEHVWLDAGTGLTAAAAILMSGALGWQGTIHVVLVAGDASSFLAELELASTWWEECFRQDSLRCDYLLHVPPTAKSFGAVNATLWEEVREIAREEGILADPVYTAKLFLTMKEQMGEFVGKHLLVHGGGGTGMMGFER